MGPSGVSFPSFTAARENLEMVACIKLSKGGAADWKTLLLPMEGEGGGSRGSIFEVKLFKIAVRLGYFEFAAARASGATQREAPRKRSSAVSVRWRSGCKECGGAGTCRISAGGANARSAGRRRIVDAQ